MQARGLLVSSVNQYIRSHNSHLFKFNAFTKLAYLMTSFPIDTIAALPTIYFSQTWFTTTASPSLFTRYRLFEITRSFLPWFASIARRNRPLDTAFHTQLITKVVGRRKKLSQPTIRDIDNTCG